MSAVYMYLTLCSLLLPAHSYQLNNALCEGSLCLYLYEAGNTYLTWNPSHTACREEGLEMLRIESSQTQTTVDGLLQYLPQNTQRQIWIGGRGSSDDTWRYMNGTEFDKTTTTEPESYPYCMRVNLCNDTSPRYEADNCDKKRSTSRVLCQYDKSRTGQCRSQDYEFGDKCYVKTRYDGFYPNRIDWYSSQTYCSQSPIQGDIAYSYLDDNQHINDVVSLLGGGDGCVELWLGVRRRTWLWKTDSGSDTSGQVIDYFNWFDDYTPIPSSDNCIYIDGDKGNKWRVQSCNGPPFKYFICMNESKADTEMISTTTMDTFTNSSTTTPTSSITNSDVNGNITNGKDFNKKDPTEPSETHPNQTIYIAVGVVGAVVIATVIGPTVFLVRRRRKQFYNAQRNVNEGNQIKELEYVDKPEDVIDPYGTTSVNNIPLHLEAPSCDLYALSTKQANKMNESQNGKALKEKINKEKMESKESDRSEVRKYKEWPAGDLYAMSAKKNNKTPETSSDKTEAQ